MMFSTLLQREYFKIRPIHDFGFKSLFSHHHDPDLLLLKHFLKSIFNEDFEILEFKDREITTAQAIAKDIRLDLRLRIHQISCNIEMQMIPTGAEGNRAFYYICQSINDQQTKGKTYEELDPIRQVFILAQDTDLAELGMNEFLFQNRVTHTVLTEDAKVYMINLEKNLKSNTDLNQMTDLQKWSVFLMYGHDVSHEWIQFLMKEKLFRKAVNTMRLINDDEELKSIAFERMRREMDNLERLKTATRNGKQEGIIEGRIEGKIEGKNEGNYFRQVKSAIEMLNDHVDVSLIMKYTDLSSSQINDIKADINSYEMMVAEKSEDYSVSRK